MTPLAGRRVLDLTRYAPGPYATLVCSALGAEVVKIEPREGDPMRALDPEGFERLNAGKKSVVLDLKSPEGVQALVELATSSDVLTESFRPGVMGRLGLDYERVAARAPRLVYVSISGYGQSGPYAHRAGHDLNYAAAAGLLEGRSGPLSFQVADFAAGGLFAVVSILSALMAGAGTYVDLSMHDALLSLSMLPRGPAFDALSGVRPSYAIYRTRDGEALSVGALEPKFWQAFCGVIERPDLLDRASDPAARDDVARIVEKRTLAEWAEAFADVDACVEPVRRAGEALAHPQAEARGRTSFSLALPGGIGVGEALGPAPSLGEHTGVVLSSLE